MEEGEGDGGEGERMVYTSHHFMEQYDKSWYGDLDNTGCEVEEKHTSENCRTPSSHKAMNTRLHVMITRCFLRSTDPPFFIRRFYNNTRINIKSIVLMTQRGITLSAYTIKY